MERWPAVEADFHRFFNLAPFDCSWRLFKNLIFSLVSEESSFYAPYLKEMYENMRENSDSSETPKVQISLEDAMKDLGVN